MKRTNRTAARTAAVLLSALALTGCSNDNDGTDRSSDSAQTEESTADFNEADVSFAQMMIPHHEQAIEMSDIVLANDAVTTEVAELAEQIKAAQQPEIETLNGWLTEWGAEAEAEMDHGDMGHDDGMMTQEDLEALESSPGALVNVMYLEQMIAHHEGAVTMAQDQVEDGQNPDAVALAQDIITTQQAEITTMQQHLVGLTDANS